MKEVIPQIPIIIPLTSCWDKNRLKNEETESFVDMDGLNKKTLPQRKNPRLAGFDYSSGVFFVTVCTQDRKGLLSDISAVGEGLAPPEEISVLLKPCGVIAKEQLFALEDRFDGLKIVDYVIMPEHIHAIIVLPHKTRSIQMAGGASPSPTVVDDSRSHIRELDRVICAFKSLTSRLCKQQHGTEKIFQRSYYEHVIRNNDDYRLCRNYILDNPEKRFLQELHRNTDK
ncbi:MAG: hypothetical protein E7619_01475 [Ruminococcaceae bacterium]|nr:hypothetical protein [Oscillospiraceae bacterium]